MLIKADRDLLGDKLLDLKEKNERMREENKQKAAQFRIPDQQLLENRDMARGWMMDWQELVRRIVKLNASIRVEQGGIPNAVAVRIVKQVCGEEVKQYVTGFVKEPLPEYSSVTVDKNGLPVREIRGWRSVLNALIRAGALTLQQVEVTFGPATGQRAILWDRQMQSKR